jgi:hypothetical protein
VVYHDFNIHCATLIAQDNPFMQMEGKKYAEYEHLLTKFRQLLPEDTVACRKMICQVDEVARKTRSMEWTLLAEYLELVLYEGKIELLGKELYPLEELLRMEQELLEKAIKAKILHIELRVRWMISDFYFNKVT